jgi:putative ABC transport system ATP-binding protein
MMHTVPGAEPVIALADVSKVYAVDRMETHALTNVHMSVAAGEFVAVAGPSGCGKSTLLSILGLLEMPTTGSYRLGGTDVATLSRRERADLRNRRIGFVYQSFNLINELTVFENVELPLAYRDMPERERHRRVEQALERVGMTMQSQRHPSKLSGGEQQRVAVARAVAGDPLILLADEPTGNLDSLAGEAVMALLGDLHRTGATICIVTHDARLAARAQRTISLFDGRIIGEHRRA